MLSTATPIVLDPAFEVDGISALAVIVIASVGTDQVVTFILSILSYSPWWAERFGDPAELPHGPERRAAAKRYKIAYMTCAGIIGGVVLAGFGEIRLLEHLLPGYSDWIAARTGDAPGWMKRGLDIVLTAVVFMFGAEKVSLLLAYLGFQVEQDPSKPVEITGTLVLDPDAVAGG